MTYDYVRDAQGNVWAVRSWECIICGRELQVWEVPDGFHQSCKASRV